MTVRSLTQRETCEKTHPVREPENDTRQPDGRGSEQRRRRSDETPLETFDLEQVLANRAHLNVVVVSLADASQEVDGVRVAEVPVDGLQDVTLRLEDLSLGV